MRYFVVFLPLSTILLVLQSSLWSTFLPDIPSPNTSLILALYLGFQTPTIAGALCAYMLGCLLDVFSGVTFGFHAIILLMVFILTAFFARQLNTDNPLTLPIATLLGTVVFAILSVLVLLLFSDHDQIWPRIISSLPAQIILNLGTVYILRPVINYLNNEILPQTDHTDEKLL